MKPATTLAVIIFSLVAIVHLLRLIFQTPIIIGSVTVPVWPSFFGFILAGALAVLVWREMRR